MTVNVASLVSDNLDVWTTAVQRKSGAGRGTGKRVAFYGVDRLRTLILDLAMRGKLVAQDPNDEPAAKLLQRVEKVRDVVASKNRDKGKEAVQPPGRGLPAGWVVARLDELANSQAGFAFKSGDFNERGIGLPLIRIRDVGQPFTGTFYAGEYREEFVVQPGDYLISMDGEFRVAPWDGEPALLNQRVSRLQFYTDEVEARFVAIELQVELAKLQGVKAYTTVDHLSGKQIVGTKISLPPLAEQRRIVAKVDELMALCDALEGESAAAMAAHQSLVEAHRHPPAGCRIMARRAAKGRAGAGHGPEDARDHEPIVPAGRTMAGARRRSQPGEGDSEPKVQQCARALREQRAGCRAAGRGIRVTEQAVEADHRAFAPHRHAGVGVARQPVG